MSDSADEFISEAIKSWPEPVAAMQLGTKPFNPRDCYITEEVVMSDSVREAFSQNVTQAIVKCGPNHLTDTFVKQVHAIAWEAHQAATAAANAEWRGVVEKLVATVQAYEVKTYGGWIVGQSKQPHELASDALAQAAQLMGRR